MKETTDIYDYISLKWMPNIATIDTSPNQKPFRKVNQWRTGEPITIDMEDYERVTSILREQERKMFDRMVTAGNNVLAKWAIPIQYDDYPDTETNQIGQTERFNRFDAAYNQLFDIAASNNLLSELGVACRDFYQPNLYNSLFLLYTLYAESAQEYSSIMENLQKISSYNAELSRCRGAVKVCQRVDVSIRGNQIVGIQLFARKRNERVPEERLYFSKDNLHRSELKWLTKVTDADIRFSEGESFDHAKAWLTKTLNRPDTLKGTKDKNNYQPKFFKQLNSIYLYILDAGIFSDAKCLPTAATIDFILNLLKLPDDSITRTKLNSYIGRKPERIAF